ncbi:hypothetical protein SUGI_0895340 [Cryptomeria japonica]|nr:hypothetical protein SUGI_0895340 [Cryptomeria japonica]
MTNIDPASSAGSTDHSPVPYLLGGIGALLALILFSLLLLACSYFNNTSRGQLRNEHGESDKDEMGKTRMQGNTAPDEMGKGVVVIMAGNYNPTFIAKPTSVEATAT